MAHIIGDFVDARGRPCRHERVPIEVTRDQARLHFRMEGSGRGTVTMHGNTGTGTFTVHGGETLKMTVERDDRANRLTYRLRRDGDVVASGSIHDLPP